MVKRGSVVWRYFDRQTNNRSEAKCTLCSKLIRCSGNTTNLMSHLKSKHAGISALGIIKSSPNAGDFNIPSDVKPSLTSSMLSIETPTTSFGVAGFSKTALFQSPNQAGSLLNFTNQHSFSSSSSASGGNDNDSGVFGYGPNNKKRKFFQFPNSFRPANSVIATKSSGAGDSSEKNLRPEVRKFWTVSYPGNVGVTTASSYNNSLFLPPPQPDQIKASSSGTKEVVKSSKSVSPFKFESKVPLTTTVFVPVQVNKPSTTSTMATTPTAVTSTNSKLRIGFVGAGNIANAIAKGLLNSGIVKSDQIFASAPSNTNLFKFKEFGCFTTNSNSKLFEPMASSKSSSSSSSKSDLTYVLFVCVKPNIILKNSDFFSFLNDSDMLSSIRSNRLYVVSVLAGVTMHTLLRSMDPSRQALSSAGISPTICRIMPNTACGANAGAIGLSFHDQKATTNAQSEMVDILSKLGTCLVVNEDQLDAVCGIAGSGIAYVYTMIQAMADGGVLSGLTREVASKLAAQTVAGAAEMVLRTGSGPIELRNNVCSPAGTTITGLQILERGRFNSSVIDAIDAATRKSKEFSSSSSQGHSSK